MPRTAPPDREATMERLLAFGDDAPSLEQRLAIAQQLRATARDGGTQIDRLLLEHLIRMRDGLRMAEAAQRELGELLERVTAPPWHPALYLRPVETDLGTRAMVLQGSVRRIVGLAEDVEIEDLAVGEEVFLAADGTLVAGRSPWGTPPYGEIATFARLTADRRCVLHVRDEEVVVDAAATLAVDALAAGDLVRWDRSAWMAFERIAADTRDEYLLDEVPDVGRERVGGQDAVLERLLSALTARLLAPDTAALYGLTGRQTILMFGPPGCGKTLMARVAAAEVARLGGRRCHFAVVKPAEWDDPFVGVTGQKIRACFASLARAAADGYAVLFLDEIETIGRTRGAASNIHGDRALGVLLAELDGFAERANVAVIAATNRRELLDSALVSRFDVEVAVGRPDLHGAGAIFGLHLPATLPLAPDTDDHAALAATATTRLYAPNAETALATVRFRDGTTRIVHARELASGRLFTQICRAACQRAYLRDVRGGGRGVGVADVEHAVDEALIRLAATLTRRNVHDHLADLPDDAEVVGIEPIARRSTRPYRYERAA